MRTLKRILLITLFLIAILVFGGLIFLNNVKNNALPDYSADVKLQGISDEVTIFRDSLAIPHIYAKTENDLYFAVGYVLGQDRLWQMDLLRRVTQGRLSEILGSDLVDVDVLMRSLRIQEKSEMVLENTDPVVLEALQSFSDGLNSYIKTHPLPPEFRILGYHTELWEPIHSINLIGYMAWDLAMAWPTEVLLLRLEKEIGAKKLHELLPDLSKHETTIFPEFDLGAEIELAEIFHSSSEKIKQLGLEVFCGSNNWAIAGEKTTSGKPLLANDMHLGLNAPGTWTQMHQVVEGKLNLTGVVLPGQPFVISGHNDSIAWGMTNVMVDDMDFYIETLNDDSTKYLLNGEWRDLKIINEVIPIKGGETVEKTVWFTHRGPLVNRFKKVNNQFISMQWTGNGESNEIRSVYKLNRAANWADFRDAVSTFTAVSQNIVYADNQGNIGLQTCAGVPMREGNGIQIYPGDTTKYDWKGLVPFEELPYEFNPERGYVSSANNKTVPDDYPHYISMWFAQPDRINRIRELLNTKNKMGVNDVQQIQSDFKSNLVETALPQFLPALELHDNWNELEMTAHAALINWDGTMERESNAAAIFEIMYRKIFENLIKDDLNKGLFTEVMGNRKIIRNLLRNILQNENSLWIDNSSTPEVESLNDIIVQSFKDAVVELKETLGVNPKEWQWQNIHTFTLKHPLGSVKMLDVAFSLNKGPYGVPGSYHTVCPYSYSYNKLYEVNHGASQRHVYDFSNWDASTTVIPTGVSGIPSSPYYCNQTELYINNQYHADYFSRQAVEGNSLYEMSLIPVE